MSHIFFWCFTPHVYLAHFLPFFDENGTLKLLLKHQIFYITLNTLPLLQAIFYSFFSCLHPFCYFNFCSSIQSIWHFCSPAKPPSFKYYSLYLFPIPLTATEVFFLSYTCHSVNCSIFKSNSTETGSFIIELRNQLSLPRIPFFTMMKLTCIWILNNLQIMKSFYIMLQI